MEMDLDIWVDLRERVLVQGVSSSAPPTLSFYQGDTYRLRLRGLVPSADVLGQIYRPADISYGTIAAGLFAGGPDAPPTGGTWKVRFDGETTGELSWNIGKGELQNALNALSTVTAAGGLKILADETQPGNFYTVQWNDEEPDEELEIVEIELAPLCIGRSRRNASSPGQALLKLIRAPLAFTSEFELPEPPPIAIAQVRAGSATRNEIQSVTVPQDAIGEFSLRWEGTASQVVPVASASASEIARVLNEIFSDGKQRFSVTNPSRGVFYIEFIGLLAKADQSLLQSDMYSQTAVGTPTGRLAITGEVPTDLELLGRPGVQVVLEIASWDEAGDKLVLAQRAVNFTNNAIDAGLAGELAEGGLIGVQTDTVYINQGSGTEPVVEVSPGFVFSPTAAGASIEITHDLNTWWPAVRIHYRDSMDPESWTEVPDDQYETIAISEMITRIEGIPLSNDPGSLLYFERWKFFLTSPDAKVQLLEHRHPTDDIDGVGDEDGKTLTEIIGELRAAMPDGWPNIPANKIVGPLPLDLIDMETLIASITEGGESTTLFLEGLRELVKDRELIENLVHELHTSESLKDTFQALVTKVFTEFASAGMRETLREFFKVASEVKEFRDTIEKVLTDSPAIAQFLGELIHENIVNVLTGSGSALAPGVQPILVPAFNRAVPPARELLGGSVSESRGTEVVTQTNAGGSIVTTRPATYATRLRVPAFGTLSPAILAASATTPGTLTGVLPQNATLGAVYTVGSAGAESVTGTGRRGQTFAEGAKITFAAGHWYEVTLIGSDYWPIEYEMEVAKLHVTADSLYDGTVFSAVFPLWLKLDSDPRHRISGAGLIILEKGARTGALTSIAWTTLASVRVLLSDALALTELAVAVNRSALGTFSASVKVNGRQTSTPEFTSGDFSLRVRLSQVDFEDAPTTPRGSLIVRMTAARAGIAPLA